MVNFLPLRLTAYDFWRLQPEPQKHSLRTLTALHPAALSAATDADRRRGT